MPGFSEAGLGRLSGVLRDFVAAGRVAGVVGLLARGDEVFVEGAGWQDREADRPMRRDTIFRVASMTKPVTAVAALLLAEEGRLQLDDPVEGWLPELTDRRVLRRLDGPLGDTMPAERPITTRDLLDFTWGFGAVMAAPGSYPIQKAVAEAGLAPGPISPPFSPDEYMARLGAFPLMHQPGERWMYHTGSDVLGVLVSRVAGVGLAEFFEQRIFGPMGMADTGFTLPAAKLDRLAACYTTERSVGLVRHDDRRDGGVGEPAGLRVRGRWAGLDRR